MVGGRPQNQLFWGETWPGFNSVIFASRDSTGESHHFHTTKEQNLYFDLRLSSSNISTTHPNNAHYKYIFNIIYITKVPYKHHSPNTHYKPIFNIINITKIPYKHHSPNAHYNPIFDIINIIKVPYKHHSPNAHYKYIFDIIINN